MTQPRRARKPSPPRIRHPVTVDETRERLAPSPQPLDKASRQELEEELGETYVENVTGADDAATEHRAAVSPDEAGSGRS